MRVEGLRLRVSWCTGQELAVLGLRVWRFPLSFDEPEVWLPSSSCFGSAGSLRAEPGNRAAPHGKCQRWSQISAMPCDALREG